MSSIDRKPGPELRIWSLPVLLPGTSVDSTATVYSDRLLAYASGSHVVVENIVADTGYRRCDGDGTGSSSSSRATLPPLPPLPRRAILSPKSNAKSSQVTALAWHPRAPLLAAGDVLGTVNVYDVSCPHHGPVASLTQKDYTARVIGGGASNQAPVISLAYATASCLLVILLRGGTLALFDLQRHQLVYLKQFGEEFEQVETNPADARMLILANNATGVFTNLYIRSLKSEKQIRVKRFQIGDGSVQLRDVRWVGGRLNSVLLVLLEREVIVFDVEYGTSLWSGGVGRGLSGFRRVVWVDRGSSVGMPARVVCRHAGGEVSVWGLKSDDVGYSMTGWWSTKAVGGVGHLAGLEVDNSRGRVRAQSFVGLRMGGDTFFRWEVCLRDAGDDGEVPAKLREMRQGLSGRVTCLDSREGLIAVGTEHGFVELYACESGSASASGSASGSHGNGGQPPRLEKKILAADSMVLSGVAWMGKYASSGARRLVTFASHRQNDGMYRNIVRIVDVRSGWVETIKNVCEGGMIKEAKPSYSGAYLLLVCVGIPNELWWTGGGGTEQEQERVQRLRQVDLDFTSVSWIDTGPHGKDAATTLDITSPAGPASPGSRMTTPEEMFAFSLSDARLGILLVKGRKIQDTRPVAPSWAPLLTGEFQVTSCAPSRQYVFLGSRDGTLARWDTTTGETVAVETGCGRISKVVLLDESTASASAWPTPTPTLLALLSSSGTFAVLVVDGEGKFKTTKITWSTGVSSVGYASDVSFYSSDALMVRLREGGVSLLRIQGTEQGRHHELDHSKEGLGLVVAPGARRLVSALVQGGLDIELADDALDGLDEQSILDYLPINRGASSKWDDALTSEMNAKATSGSLGAAVDAGAMQTTAAATASAPASATTATTTTITTTTNPAMAELLNSRATDDADSPLYSPTGQSSVDRAAFQTSMRIDASTATSAGTKTAVNAVNAVKSKSSAVTSKVLKTISTIAKDKDATSNKSSSKDRRADLVSSVLVPQSPAAVLSPRHGLSVSHDLRGVSPIDAVRRIARLRYADRADRASIDADFGTNSDDPERDDPELLPSPARRMAVAARIAWDDRAYAFWKELDELLGSTSSSMTTMTTMTTMTMIQDLASHTAALGELSKWHANAVLDDRSIVELAVIELISLGDVEAAVSLLLTSPPEDTPHNTFYRDALCALGLAYSTLFDESSLFSQAARVIAINAATGLDDSLVSIPILYAIGKFAEVCQTLQSEDMWLCGAALAACKLSDGASAGQLKAVLRAHSEHLAHKRGAVWEGVGVLIGGGMYDDAVQLLLGLKKEAEARGLIDVLVHYGLRSIEQLSIS